MMRKQACVWRLGAGLALGLLLVLMVLAPFGVSVAGDGGLGGGIPLNSPDTTQDSTTAPDTIPPSVVL